jgi:hypothetical protein
MSARAASHHHLPSSVLLRGLASIAGLVGIVLAIAAGHAAHAQPASTALAALAAQSSEANGVTVKVTPPQVLAASPEWTFVVALDTHSQDLGDDLVNTAVLLVDGVELKPLRWAGPAAGGHHREGMLVFANPGSQPAKLELRLPRAGEASPRVLQWNLKP